MALPMVTACNDDDDSIDYTLYYDWRDENDAFTKLLYDVQKKDSAQTYFSQTVYSLKEPLSYPSFVHYVHHANIDSLRNLTPRKDYRPFSTSTLSVHYTLFDSHSVYEKLRALGSNESVLHNMGGAIDSIFFANAEDNVLKADTLESSQVAFFKDFTPNTVIDGWGDILQQMYIGDHVVACIPWFIAYGQKGSLPTIDPFTNLFFRIELCDITYWGGTVE